MARPRRNPTASETDSSWASLYKVGATAALLTVLVGLLEIGITFLPGGGISETPATATDWFALLQTSPFLGLRNLGLVNFALTALDLLLNLALYGAHRRVDQAYAAFAFIVGALGTAIFFATNRAFPMLALSNDYAAATTDAQRAVIEAAGQSMLSVGQSHSSGTFIAFLFAGAGGVTMSVVMLRGGIFNRASAYVGIMGFGCLLVFEVCNSFVPTFSGAMVFAIAGGILNLVWCMMIAPQLFRLGCSLVKVPATT